MKSPVLRTAAWLSRRMPGPVRQRLYRLGPVTRWLRAALNRAAPVGLTEVTIAAGALKGLRMALDLQAEKDYWLGNYEPQLEAALRDFTGPGMTVYDVGANIGYVTLLLGLRVGDSGLVHAFEALPENVSRLEANVVRNGFAGRTRIHHAAVLDRSGVCEFLVHASPGMGKASGSAGRSESYQSTIAVPAISLDDFHFERSEPAPDLIKMDIEGGEIMALHGMRRLLGAIRPVLLLELHGQAAAETAWEVLAEAGYALHRMQTGYPRIESRAALGWKAYALALPDSSI